MPDDPITPDDLTTRITELESDLAEARTALDRADRLRQLHLELTKADAIDLDTAALLAERALAETDDADIPNTVADLKRNKPFLFRKPAPPTPTPRHNAALAPHHDPPDPVQRAATAAARSNDRNALMRYLRLRRTA